MVVAGKHQDPPLLSLRMRTKRPGYMQKRPAVNVSDTIDVLETLLTQEDRYRCRDYIERRRSRQEAASAASSSCRDPPPSVSADCSSSTDSEDMDVDAICREKMCEWSFRVCEHFRTSREIVSYSQAFLDRFIDKCSCDRTAFKLAAMTTLYMSTKMFNSKQISIQSLADLSRGEFEVAHIAEMERIIIETLDWRLNPPTPHSYINSFTDVLMVQQTDEHARQVHQRASFFSELAVYDYNFVTESPCLIAVCCLLNAFEWMEDVLLGDALRQKLLEYLLPFEMNVHLSTVDVERTQTRLWYLYSCSAQVQEDSSVSMCSNRKGIIRQSPPSSPSSASSASTLKAPQPNSTKIQSPVCVKNLKHV